jgi:2-polyprenyl-6-methoxyphenol hydroxylase-like FAD-dependent oxidoreductase
MDRVVIVGGGVLGLMHAVAARQRGFDVVHLERELYHRSQVAPGVQLVTGRAAGA